MTYVISACLFRLVLPLLLFTCVVFRPSALSGVYLVAALISAFLPVPTNRTMKGCTGIYLKILLGVSLITLLMGLAFQIYLLASGPYGEVLTDNKDLERVLRYCGFVRLDKADYVTIITWISPELLAFITTIVVFVLARRLSVGEELIESETGEDSRSKMKSQEASYLVSIGKYAILFLLCVSAALRPSVQGGLYFLVFICSATWLSCSKNLARGFAFVIRLLLIVIIAHIVSLYTLQIQYFQELLSDNSQYQRYFALTIFYTIDESADPRQFIASSQEWDAILNPVVLVLLFFVTAMVAKEDAKPKPKIKPGAFSRLEGSFNGPLRRQVSKRLSDRRLLRSATTRTRWHSATRKVRVNHSGSPSLLTEQTPLMRGVSPSRRYGSDKKKGPSVLQDSTGSDTLAGGDQLASDIDGAHLDEEEKVSCLENFIFLLEQFLQFVVKVSYIATNIIMMTWSITYHSWLTFVLLIWANILWIIPNQRKSMLKCSPFLVFYAIFLLLSGYIYSMDLTEEELPSQLADVNLAQIGFIKILEFPCKHLLAKSAFTIMFWFTLRQYTTELKQAKQRKSLADMAAPLQVSVSAAAGIPPEHAKHSKVLQKIGEYLSKVFVRFWIWVVAIILFVVAITGERMTVFRILYMALFLFFILTFQLSFNFWRKMMFAFLLIVIIYSMLILILVYTYQFDNFSTYWTEYLHVPLEQQLDIGLETYKTTQLFVRLATPTCFIIVTAIQLHYFHKDFLHLTDESAQHAQAGRMTSLANSSMPETTSERRESDVTDAKLEITDTETIPTKKDNTPYKYFTQKCQEVLNLICLYLEIQMHRAVLLIGAFMCIYDKCALYSVVIPLLVIGLIIGRKLSLAIIKVISIFTAVKLLAQMVYQVQYIHHDWSNTTCDISTNNYTVNNAEWFGFYKSSHMASIVSWNIVYLTIATLYSVVLIRQHNYRIAMGLSMIRPFFLFPNARRFDAEKGVLPAFKFLCNHGYYKFGYEISLMATVGLIGMRMDLYALCYTVWLCILCFLKRDVLRAGMWTLFLFFIAITIPIQYVLSVGLLPSLCIDFPWDDTPLLRRLQEWAFLMDTVNPPNVKRLVCDFILLLFVARQRVVFRIEQRFKNREYPGGSNDSIVHLAETDDFVNPVPDYITYARTYLDVIKRLALLSFMWITLAMLFLAGANRVNIYAVGYLLGSFVFLWQGTELYLKPLPTILRSWNILLCYSVLVIFLKTTSQFVGCVLIGEATPDLCWVIQLLGIGCLNKFDKTGKPMSTQDCYIPRDSLGIAWDGICFAFLIMQKRLFCSYNFFHIVDETKASTILASRGADLIEVLRERRMQEQAEHEKLVLEKIKVKMDRIKATQEKIQGPNYQEVNNHYIVRSSSASSCVSATSQTPEAGYHTPIDEDEPAPLTPAAGSSLIQPQAPSPFSAIMTVSLEGYLEPQRMSFSSPPNSELNPRPPSPDDSYPVFSPPPYEEAPTYAQAVTRNPRPAQRQTSLGPPWMNSLTTPRQSVISYSSRISFSSKFVTNNEVSNELEGLNGDKPIEVSEISDSGKENAIRSGDYYMFDELDDDEDLDIVEHTKQPLDDEDEKERGVNIGRLLSNTLKSDISTVVRKDRLQRRASIPAERRLSSKSTRSQAHSAPPVIEESPQRRKRSWSSKKEPKAGPSTEPDEYGDSYDQPLPQTRCQSFMDYLIYIWKLIESLMVSIIRALNKHSRDFRYVRRVLVQEKKILKETTNYTKGVRLGKNKVWQPASSYQALLQTRIVSALDVTPSVGSFSPSDSYRLGVSIGRESTSGNTQNSQNEESEPSGEPSTKPKEPSSQHSSPQKERRKPSVLTVPEIRILAPSMERGLDTATNYSGSAEIIEFEEEGELSQYDQPTVVRLLIAIWYIIISNSAILCYVMIFLNQMKSATFMSLPLPLLVFIWGTLTIPRPTKSFWVTIIAYTQIIVLIKCIFQFEFWPWNQPSAITNTSPYYPPRILGIEQNQYYAVWDLLLLLVIYFHRFLLKSVGLWTSVYITVPVLSDGTYAVQEIKKKSPIQLNEDNMPLDDEDTIHVSVKTDYAEPVDLFPETIQMSTLKYSESIKEFIRQLRDPTSRASADVYSYMFLCDFFNFFVILIGYTSFGEQQSDEGGVSSYLQDNRVPHLFLLMLILQFLLIIVDRAIFLRKNITAKIVFQYIQIIMLHCWLFILFPIITDRYFNSVIPPQMYYMVKCFYLLLSAYQIRCGYPSKILGNFLCKSYNYVNKFLFQGFMLVPFLFELRTVMDWMWTDTSMTVFDWIKMEDIFATIFQIKCIRRAETDYPQPRGEKKASTVKYIMGGFLLFTIVAIIWFPLVFFSLGNAVGQPNVPYDVTLTIRIGPYEPVYHITAQANSIFNFTERDYGILEDTYKKNKIALTFIKNYQAADIAAVKLSGESSTVWTISPPDRERMIEEVESSNLLQIHLQYKISHKSGNKEDTGLISENVDVMMPAMIDGKPNMERQKLLQFLWGNETSIPPVNLGYILPKFIKVTNRGIALPVTQLMDEQDDPKQSYLRSLNLTLSHSEKQSTEQNTEWWTIQENCSDFNYKVYLRKLSYGDCSSIVLYTFNDRIFPATLSIITAGGIIGVYTTLVFLASRFLRGFFSEICFKIMFDDMPNVDRVLQLCHDIYLVREAREFCLEEDLFAKLVFLFRSPETLIKWTRPKEEGEDEDNPEGDS